MLTVEHRVATDRIENKLYSGLNLRGREQFKGVIVAASETEDAIQEAWDRAEDACLVLSGQLVLEQQRPTERVLDFINEDPGTPYSAAFTRRCVTNYPERYGVGRTAFAMIVKP